MPGQNKSVMFEQKASVLEEAILAADTANDRARVLELNQQLNILRQNMVSQGCEEPASRIAAFQNYKQ